MGRSAKVHKRVKSLKEKPKLAAASVLVPTPQLLPPPGSSSAGVVAPPPTVKRRATLKEKAKAKAKGNSRLKDTASGSEGPQYVLGGADYVDLMMGSRRRAREEAAKLPLSD